MTERLKLVLNIKIWICKEKMISYNKKSLVFYDSRKNSGLTVYMNFSVLKNKREITFTDVKDKVIK